jgi:predicted glycoside hydrolase/deacetylase ChbG (UPF0249 family)
MARHLLLTALLVATLLARASGQTTSPLAMAAAPETTPTVNLFGDDKVRFIFRADDAGFCHSSNMALERILDAGLVTAVSVIVNTGWLDETVDILKRHPGVSIGVHVCLNSEWVPYKWGPVLPAKEVPSLVDEWGHFFGTRKDMLAHNPNLDQVEAEIRAQVDLAKRKGLKLSYMDHHMSAAVTTPEMRERFVKVARENGLGISRWFGEAQGPVIYSVDPAQKTDFMLAQLRKITRPGVYLVVCHTLVKTPEVEVLHDLNLSGPRNMADHRHAEMEMLCDPRVKQLIQDRHIELTGYDTLQSRFLDQMHQPPD